MYQYQQPQTTVTLADLIPNQKFKIIRVNAYGEIKRRLIEMGFLPGTEGVMLRKALLNDPIEIFIKSYRISLRLAEAKQILVEKV